MNEVRDKRVTVNGCSGFDEGPVEEVSVVGDEDVRLHVQDVVEELLQQADLVLVKIKKRPMKKIRPVSRAI